MKTKNEALMLLREATTSEEAAVAFFESRLWGEHPRCPRCGGLRVAQVRGKDGKREKAMRWRCKDCLRLHSVRTGTVLADSRLPLTAWAHIFWRACASKKGCSALQISRELGITHTAALFALNRIRFGVVESPDVPRLTGTCEADEAFVGGKWRRRNNEAPGSPTLKRGPKGNLAPVIGVVQRSGHVRLRHVTKVTALTLRHFLQSNMRPSAVLMTDDFPKYLPVGRTFAAHDTVNHTRKEYARGDVNTNSIESVFALMKRSVYGVYHSVSQEHLHRYIAEWQFRYNARKVSDAERVDLAIRSAQGKRLLYREPSSPARAA